MGKIKIFDFDGTIADTEKISWEAHNQLLRPFGIHLKLEQIQKYIGNCDEQIAKMLNQENFFRRFFLFLKSR